MARSRNIKPGLFTNDELAECDIYARFLFTGLWTIADKLGRLEDKSKKIKILVLPYDNVDCDDLLSQLHKKGFILRYSVKDKNYIQIVNWAKHQNPHKNENESQIPGPDILIEKNNENINKSSSPDNIKTHPADSFNLISDSLNLIPLHSKLVEKTAAYAFFGEIIKLNHADFDKWQLLYPNVNLFHELKRLDLEFRHQKPKNWFVTASQKINYQNKQRYKYKKNNHLSMSSSHPPGFRVVN